MSYECVVGLKVMDDEIYSDYRRAMTPLLESFGGGFRYDFTIKDVLRSETENQINRVFLIYFESEDSMSSFFGDQEYIKIKNKFFDKSVEATTIISQYSR
jgi:uncharacterized protein (DUF1330 family)